MPLALPPPEPPQSAIVITAQRLADPASEKALNVETIGRDALAGAASRELDQVLRGVPGVQMFRRSDSRSSHPTSQGVTLRALGGNASSRALLMLDGVPQADPFGGWVNWPAYDPGSLEQVRVIRGGGSVAYGPGALAGVIDMASDVRPATAASVEAGSRRSVEGSFRTAASVGAGIVGVTGSAGRGDGFIPVTQEDRGPADRPANYRAANIRAFWVTPLADELDFKSNIAAFIDRRNRGLAFTANRTRGADVSAQLLATGRWPWSATLYAQVRNLRSSFAAVDAARSVASRVSLQHSVPSRAVGGSFEVRPAIGAAELRLGGDLRATSGETRERYAYVEGQPTRSRVAGGRTLTAGAFAELSRGYGPISLSAAARIDHWRIGNGRLEERLIANGAVLRDDDYADRSGWLPTARVGAVWAGSAKFSVRGAAYTGWRLATLNELYRPFRAGPDATAANPGLDPERLVGAEAGANLAGRWWDASATLFAQRLSDGIANVTLGSGPGIFPGVGFVGGGGEFRRRENIDGLDVRGVEAAVRLRSGAWSGSASTSLVDATIKGSGAAAPLDGLRPAQTPRIAFTIEAGWHKGGRSLSAVLRHVGGQYEDDLNLRHLPAATTIDASATWPLADRLSLLLRGENLLNEDVVAGLSADGTVERASPRTLWVGLRLTRRDR